MLAACFQTIQDSQGGRLPTTNLRGAQGSSKGRLGIPQWGGNLRPGHPYNTRGRALGEMATSHFRPPSQQYLSAEQRCRGPKQTESLPVLDQVGAWQAASPVDRQHVTLVTQLNLERCPPCLPQAVSCSMSQAFAGLGTGARATSRPNLKCSQPRG